jgi:hypothetical protein
MATRAHDFYSQHVLPSIRDWETNETEMHRAMAVATNLSHLADYYRQSYSDAPERLLGARSLGKFKAELARLHAEYGLLRDVADAHKHLKLDRADRHVTSAGQSTTMSMGWGEAKWGQARWGSPEEVVVTDDSGEKHHFRALVQRTLQMWQGLLQIQNGQ